MSQKIVNLSKLQILSKIEEVLSRCPDHPHQQAFAIPMMREELLAYVLNHVQNQYAVVEGDQVISPPLDREGGTSEEQMEAWVHQGMQQLLQQHAEQIAHHIPEADDPGTAPSHWFG